MSLTAAFDIAGTGLQAQSARLNAVASNLANAGTVAAEASDVYQTRYPIFRASVGNALDNFDNLFQAQFAEFSPGGQLPVAGGVEVPEILTTDAMSQRRFSPSHPLADEQGYVHVSAVNVVEQMADMISASRSFEMNAQVANTSKSMMQRLVTLGR